MCVCVSRRRECKLDGKKKLQGSFYCIFQSTSSAIQQKTHYHRFIPNDGNDDFVVVVVMVAQTFCSPALSLDIKTKLRTTSRKNELLFTKHLSHFLGKNVSVEDNAKNGGDCFVYIDFFPHINLCQSQ